MLLSPEAFRRQLVERRISALFVTTGERSINEGRMQAQRMDGALGKVVLTSAR